MFEQCVGVGVLAMLFPACPGRDDDVLSGFFYDPTHRFEFQGCSGACIGMTVVEEFYDNKLHRFARRERQKGLTAKLASRALKANRPMGRAARYPEPGA